jgi:hypothetical protein
MSRPVANFAAAGCFLLLGFGFAYFSYQEWVYAPDCARAPASCVTFAAVHATWAQGMTVAVAFVCFALAARVIWNMRHGDRS